MKHTETLEELAVASWPKIETAASWQNAAWLFRHTGTALCFFCMPAYIEIGDDIDFLSDIAHYRWRIIEGMI